MELQLTVLAQFIITAGLKKCFWSKSYGLKERNRQAVESIVEDINKQSKKVGNSYEMIEQVATISANNDNVIGGLIVNDGKGKNRRCYHCRGKPKGTDTTVEVVEGI